MRAIQMFVLWLLIQFGFVAVVRGDTIPFPADGKDLLVGLRVEVDKPATRPEVTRGILLYREVYDYQGRKVAIEESTDARPRPAPKATPKPKAEARTETLPPPFMFFQNKWWKWDGTRYLFCEECDGLPGPEAKAVRSVPQANPTMPGTIVRVVAVPNMTYQASTPTSPTTTYAVSADSLGGTSKV